MGIVIAVFIIAAVYVGYYASQEHTQEGEVHNVLQEPNLPSFVMVQTPVNSDQPWIN